MNGIGDTLLTSGFALDLVLKATVILCAAGAISLVLPRASAAARHLVWTAAVVGLVSLPLLSLVLPSWEVPVERAEPVQTAAAWTAKIEAGPPLTDEVGSGKIIASSAESGQASAPHFLVEVAATARERSVTWATWIFAIWAVGTAALLLRLLLGWWGVRRLSHRSEVVTDPAWTQLLKDTAWMLDVERKVTLIRSSRASMPMTWGTLRPTVLLPVEADQWAEERRRVVLLHEMAHVSRRDCLTQMLADLACAFYWFHPLTWIAAGRLRAERERACDDQVLGAGERASAYATHLLEVARAFRPIRPFGAAIAMARPSQLEGRLLAVLDQARSRRAPGPRARAAGLVLASLLLLPLAAVRTVAAYADEGPGSSASMISWKEPPVQEDPGEAWAAGPDDRVIEREVAARPGESVRLDLDTGGNVRIVGWDRESAYVRAVLRGDDLDNTSVELTQKGSGVVLTSEYLGNLEHRNTSHSFELRVPFQSNVQLHSGGGEVTIDGVRGRLAGATGGGNVRLRNVAGSAALVTGGGEIHVSDSQLDGEVRTGGGEVRIVNNRGSLEGHTGGGNVYLDSNSTASVTSTSQSAAGEIFRFRTGGGDVRIGDAPWGADVTTGGGDIRIRSAGRDVIARTGGGDVRIGSVAGRVKAATGGGDVTIGPAAGAVEVTTGSGAVAVSMLGGAGNRDVEISSGSGSITLDLPANFDGEFDIEIQGSRNSNHRIRSDFELRQEPSSEASNRGGRTRATGRTGSGANRIRIRTANGDVVIRRAGAAATASFRSDPPLPPRAGEPGPVPSAAPAPRAPDRKPVLALASVHEDFEDFEDFDDFIEHTVEIALRSAGQALSEAELGKLIGDITVRATQFALAAASDAITVDLIREIEHEVRVEIDAALKNMHKKESRSAHR